ncbi:hypothetical protein ACGFY7_06015 [Streptomyces prunicolor]|uniref:hypothetical protein n=1 Tax=Streptomyces prunicolor TaxID=67348 RepID=UPI003710EAF4
MSSHLAILNNELTDTAVSGLKVTGDVRQVDRHGDSARFVALPDADALNRPRVHLSAPEITVGLIPDRGVSQASNRQAAP